MVEKTPCHLRKSQDIFIITLFWLYSHTNLSKQQELGTASHICKNEVNLALKSVTSTIDLKGAYADRLVNLNMKWLSFISEYIKQDTI